MELLELTRTWLIFNIMDTRIQALDILYLSQKFSSSDHLTSCKAFLLVDPILVFLFRSGIRLALEDLITNPGTVFSNKLQSRPSNLLVGLTLMDPSLVKQEPLGQPVNLRIVNIYTDLSISKKIFLTTLGSSNL